MSGPTVFSCFRIALALSLIIGASTARALTCNEAIDLAEAHAPELRARQDSAMAARTSRIAAGELPDPRLVVGVDNLPVQGSEAWSATRDFMTMQHVGVVQDVVNGDKREAERRLAEARVARTDMELVLERLNVRRQVMLAWLGVYYAEQRRDLLDRLDADNGLQGMASSAQLKAGKDMAAESVQARLEAARLADQRDELQRNIAAARAELARWIGPAAYQPLTGELPVYAVHAEHLHHHLEQHPDIAVYGAKEASAQAEVALAEAGKKSDWGVELDYLHRGPAFGDMVSVQFTFGLPVFSHTRQDPQIAARKKEAEQVTEEKEAMLRQHEVELETLLAEEEALNRQIGRVDREWLPLRHERLQLAMAAYRSGREPLATVLDSRRDLLDTRMKRIDLEERRSATETTLRYLSEEALP